MHNRLFLSIYADVLPRLPVDGKNLLQNRQQVSEEKRRWYHGKLVVLDISESGRQIGEKLFAVLNADKKKGLTEFVREYEEIHVPCFPSNLRGSNNNQSLTELREGALYVCLEQRLVQVREQVVDLTVKEFDILALLIRNPKRVFTYEMIIELVWNEDYSNYSRKAVNNHISNMRKKLKISPDVPDYIKSVSGVGYKFDI